MRSDCGGAPLRRLLAQLSPPNCVLCVFGRATDTRDRGCVVRKLRLVVANRPRLMRELVLETLSNQPDLEVVGETKDELEITELVDRTRPDCVIVAQDEREARPGLWGFLLGRYPQMKVLAITPDSGGSTLFWAVVEIHTKDVETSQQGLLEVLRSSHELLENEIRARTIYAGECEET
jgi:chemotaxis response regulator CheB